MVKNHLKRISAPKFWKIKRKKEGRFVKRPNPGQSSFSLGLPLTVIIRDMLKYANSVKEVKKILNEGNVLVDGKVRKDPKFITGFMDIISFPKTKESYRILINEKKRLFLIKVKNNESKIKPCKIIGKTLVKGKMQINLYDSKNMFVDNKEYKVGDSLVIELPENKIKEYLKFEKGAQIILIGGKHTGKSGAIESIEGNKIHYKDETGDVHETMKEYAFIIGKGGKSSISIK